MLHSVSPIADTTDLCRPAVTKLLSGILENHLTALEPGATGLRYGLHEAAFDTKAAEIEGVSRLLWGLIPAIRGKCAVPGLDVIMRAMADGTDPENPGYWGLPLEMDQRIVEMAPIAVLLRDAPEVFAKHMSDAECENLYRWLATIEQARINPSNWRFFRILVLDALRSVGWPIDEAVLRRELAFIDTQYVGEGWYQDGEYARRFDLYNPCAFHFYGLLYARWHKLDDPERSARFISRAQTFAMSYRHWFADDGAMLAYGRSLTYRFSAAGFWGLLAEIGHPLLDFGKLRGLWSRAMRWWLDKPIWDENGRMTLGYAYPNLQMTEFYNSAQSPLWALKAFTPLALGQDHPFWTTPECRDPAAEVHTVNATSQITWQANGVGYMVAPPPRFREIRYAEDKYAKLAYSTHHGFCVQSTEWISSGFAGDNLIALSQNGEDWVFRREVEESRLIDGELMTQWSPIAGCRVTCLQRPSGNGEARTIIIDADGPLQIVVTGHAADLWVPPRSLKSVLDGEEPSRDQAAAMGAALLSDIRCSGDTLARRVLPCAPNTNLIFPHCAVPALVGSVPAGRTELRTYLAAGRRSYAAV